MTHFLKSGYTIDSLSDEVSDFENGNCPSSVGIIHSLLGNLAFGPLMSVRKYFN